ncbi:MAG: LPS export ABC transporter periplasmic protein LptC [Negativicutes bacterium]|jgi:LPS export ABC transporter protein LptC
MKKYFLLALIPLAIAAGIIYLYVQPLNLIYRTIDTDNLAGNLTFKDNVIEEIQNARVVWRLKVEKIEYSNNKQKVYIKKIAGIIYTAEGDKIEVSAPEGEIDMKTHDATLFGGTTASCAAKNAKMFAPTIKYFATDQHAEAETGVKCQKDDITLTGDKVITDAAMTLITVKGKAKIRKEAAK